MLADGLAEAAQRLAALPRRAPARRSSRRPTTTTSLPCTGSGRNGSGGALRSTIHTVMLVAARGGELAIAVEHLLRLLQRIDDQPGQHLAGRAGAAGTRRR